jgi:hypothetical protein
VLNLQPGDTLDDLYPGSGAITLAWDRWQAQRALWGSNGEPSEQVAMEVA